MWPFNRKKQKLSTAEEIREKRERLGSGATPSVSNVSRSRARRADSTEYLPPQPPWVPMHDHIDFDGREQEIPQESQSGDVDPTVTHHGEPVPDATPQPEASNTYSEPSPSSYDGGSSYDSSSSSSVSGSSSGGGGE